MYRKQSSYNHNESLYIANTHQFSVEESRGHQVILFMMYSARLAVKVLQILFPEFAKLTQNRYKSER